MDARKEYCRRTAASLNKEFAKRNIGCEYFEDPAEAVRSLIGRMKEGSSISWGGSMTLAECGLIDALKQEEFTLYDRSLAETPEHADAIYHKALGADYYFLSSNAITKDGKLVNIDGRGNRLAAMIYGPKKVFVVAGINKVCADESSALDRVKNLASPLNVQRLDKNTPCAKTGFCEDCQSIGCICCQTVITRRSAVKDRITVILIGESLGY